MPKMPRCRSAQTRWKSLSASLNPLAVAKEGMGIKKGYKTKRGEGKENEKEGEKRRVSYATTNVFKSRRL